MPHRMPITYPLVRIMSSSGKQKQQKRWTEIEARIPGVWKEYNINVPREELTLHFVNREGNVVDPLDETKGQQGILILFDLYNNDWIPKLAREKFKTMPQSEFNSKWNSWSALFPYNPEEKSQEEGIEEALQRFQIMMDECSIIYRNASIRSKKPDPDPNERRLAEKKFRSARKRARKEDLEEEEYWEEPDLAKFNNNFEQSLKIDPLESDLDPSTDSGVDSSPFTLEEWKELKFEEPNALSTEEYKEQIQIEQSKILMERDGLRKQENELNGNDKAMYDADPFPSSSSDFRKVQDKSENEAFSRKDQQLENPASSTTEKQ